MSDEDIQKLLSDYDDSEIGSEERRRLGDLIDKVGSKMKETHIRRHIRDYEERRKDKK